MLEEFTEWTWVSPRFLHHVGLWRRHCISKVSLDRHCQSSVALTESHNDQSRAAFIQVSKISQDRAKRTKLWNRSRWDLRLLGPLRRPAKARRKKFSTKFSMILLAKFGSKIGHWKLGDRVLWKHRCRVWTPEPLSETYRETESSALLLILPFK